MFVLYYIIFHIIFVWVVLRLVIPHLGFKRVPIPETIPPHIQKEIEELNSIAENNRHFLELAYVYVTEKHSGSRSKTVLMFWRAFQNPFLARGGVHAMHQPELSTKNTFN